MRSRSILFIILATVTVIALGILGYRYYQNGQTKTPPPTTTQQQAQTSHNSKTSQTYPVKVYFSKRPDSDNDPSKVFEVTRNSPDLKTGTYVISELLKGPSDAEKLQGYFTTIKLRSGESTCNGQDFTLVIENSVATLQFCRQFDHLGVVADGQADSSLKATLKQFSTVQKVIILNQDSNCEFDLSGMNLCKE